MNYYFWLFIKSESETIDQSERASSFSCWINSFRHSQRATKRQRKVPFVFSVNCSDAPENSSSVFCEIEFDFVKLSNVDANRPEMNFSFYRSTNDELFEMVEPSSTEDFPLDQNESRWKRKIFFEQRAKSSRQIFCVLSIDKIERKRKNCSGRNQFSRIDFYREKSNNFLRFFVKNFNEFFDLSIFVFLGATILFVFLSVVNWFVSRHFHKRRFSQIRPNGKKNFFGGNFQQRKVRRIEKINFKTNWKSWRVSVRNGK